MSSVIFIGVVLFALYASYTPPSREPLHTISLRKRFQNYRIAHAYLGLIAQHELFISFVLLGIRVGGRSR